MATKELSIIIKAVDQATGPVRAIGNAVGGFAGGASSAITRVASSFLNLRTAIAAVTGALAVRAGVNAFDQTARSLDDIGDTAGRLDLAVDTVAGLKHVAELAGNEWKTFADQVATAQRNVAQVATFGTGRAKPALDLVGVSLKERTGELRAIQDLLPEIADRLNKLPSGQRQFAAGKIFGDVKVLDLLEGGGAKLREQFDEQRRLVGITAEQTQKADEYVRAVSRVRGAWFGVKAAVVGEVAPAVSDLLNTLATRVAAIPSAVKAIVAEVRSATSVDPVVRGGAQDRLFALLDKLKNAAVVVMRETAALGYRLITNTISAAIEVVAPTIEDTLRTAIASGVRLGLQAFEVPLRLLEGIGKLPTGTTAALTAVQPSLKAQRDALVAEREQRIKDGRAGLSGVLFAADAAKVEIDTTELDQRIAAVDAKLLSQKKQRALAFAEAGRAAYADNAAAAAEWARNIAASGDEAAEAYRRVTEAQQIVGPPEPTERRATGAEQARKWVDAIEGLVARAAAGLPTISKLRAEVAGVLAAVATTTAGLEARALAARGDAAGAARVELVNQQLAERIELEKKLGVGYKAVAADLSRVQQLELSRFNVDTKAAEIIARLGKEHQRYQQVLEDNAALVQAGTLEEFQATRQNLQAAEAVRRLAAETRAYIDTLERANPELGKDVFSGLRRSVDEAERDVRTSPGQQAPGDLLTGASQGWDDFIEQANQAGEQGRQAVLSVANSFTDHLSTAIVDTIAGVKSAEEAFRQFGSSVLRQISEITTRILILNAISGIAGAFAGSGEAGGIGSKATGTEGFNPAIRGSVPIKKFAADGPDLSGLLLGGGTNGTNGTNGSTTINITIGGNTVTVVQGAGQNAADTARAVDEKLAAYDKLKRRTVAEEVVEALEAKPGLRQRFRGVTGGRV